MSVDAARDLAWEREFYSNLAEEVTRRSGLEAAPLIELTQHRMGGIGATQYGDNSFLEDDRDLVEELRQEAADLVAYVVMELQKMQCTPSEDDRGLTISHLFEAGVHACIADAHARAARRSALGIQG